MRPLKYSLILCLLSRILFFTTSSLAAESPHEIVSVMLAQEKRYETIEISALHKINHHLVGESSGKEGAFAFSLNGRLELKYRRNLDAEVSDLSYDLTSENRNVSDGTITHKQFATKFNSRYEAYAIFPTDPKRKVSEIKESGMVDFYLPNKLGRQRALLFYGPAGCELFTRIISKYQDLSIEREGSTLSVVALRNSDAEANRKKLLPEVVRATLTSNPLGGYDLTSFTLFQNKKPFHGEVFEQWESVDSIRLPRVTKLRWYTLGSIGMEYAFTATSWKVNADIPKESFQIKSIPAMTMINDYRHTIDNQPRTQVFAIDMTPEDILSLDLLGQTEKDLTKGIFGDGSLKKREKGAIGKPPTTTSKIDENGTRTIQAQQKNPAQKAATSPNNKTLFLVIGLMIIGIAVLFGYSKLKKNR